MAEYVNPQEGTFKEGHFPNTSNTILEVYRLLSIFLSSKGFADLLTNYPGEGSDPIYKIQEVEEDEITRILLNLAITARVVDDREDRVFELVSRSCGELLENSNTEPQALDLRTACNKIIHAKKIRYDVENAGLQTAYLNPYIYLYGENSGGKAWKATLDIIAFSKEYVSLVSRF